jgi:hypothetical protein
MNSYAVKSPRLLLNPVRARASFTRRRGTTLRGSVNSKRLSRPRRRISIATTGGWLFRRWRPQSRSWVSKGLRRSLRGLLRPVPQRLLSCGAESRGLWTRLQRRRSGSRLGRFRVVRTKSKRATSTPMFIPAIRFNGLISSQTRIPIGLPTFGPCLPRSTQSPTEPGVHSSEC